MIQVAFINGNKEATSSPVYQWDYGRWLLYKKEFIIKCFIGFMFCFVTVSITSCNSLTNSNNESTEEPTEVLEFKLLEDGNSFSVTGIGTDAATEIVITSSYEGKPVTKVT